jgi:hypothetical protein
MVCENTTCTVGVCDASAGGCTNVPKDCSKEMTNMTETFCTKLICQPNYGCVSVQRTCVVNNADCETGTCNVDTQKCETSNKKNAPATCAFAQLSTAGKAAIFGTGALVGIAIAAAAVVAIVGFGSKKGYDYYHNRHDQSISKVMMNPMYEKSGTEVVNPMYESPDK